MRSELTCAACSGTDMRDLGRVPDGRMFQCRTCGSLRLDCSVGSEGCLPAGYGAAYRAGHDTAKASRLYELFCEATARMDGLPRTLLDVGCGDGAFLELAGQQGWDPCGMDSDQQAVWIGRSRKLRVFAGSLGGSATHPGIFSVVTLWDVIEHIPDVEAAMSWLASAVAPHGRLILVTPRAGCFLDSLARLERAVSFRKSQRIVHLCLNRYHRHRFTPEGLTRLVRRFGFVPEQVRAIQLFSLNPERYLSGFAPGMRGWTPSASLNGLVSRAAHRVVRQLGIRNKIFVTCRKSLPSAVGSITGKDTS